MKPLWVYSMKHYHEMMADIKEKEIAEDAKLPPSVELVILDVSEA